MIGMSKMMAEKVNRGGGRGQPGCRGGQKAAGFCTYWSFRQDSVTDVAMGSHQALDEGFEPYETGDYSLKMFLREKKACP